MDNEVDLQGLMKCGFVGYLGIKLSSKGRVGEEFRLHMKQANRVAVFLNDTIWNNYVLTEIKTKIFKTTIRLIMTYTSETDLGRTETQRLFAKAEMKTETMNAVPD